MKKITFLLLMSACPIPFLCGCGGGGDKVIEAPPASEDEGTAIPGMTNEEYDKAMDEDMR